MRPSVSVVMPNFNHARFVKSALDSVITQLHEADELIVIDDASTDDSVRVIEEAIKDVPGARLIRHEENRGALATLNEGLSLATREYICFPGADDLVEADVFDLALGLLAQYPHAGYCSGIVQVIDEAGKYLDHLPTRIVLNRPGYLDKHAVARELVRDDTWINGLAFYKTVSLREAGGFRSELGNFADGFVCRLIAARHGCCFAPVTFQLWRRMSEGLSWRETLNIAHIDKIGRHAFHLMSETFRKDFPSSYPRIWLGRWRFGARYFSMRARQHYRWRTMLAWSDTHALLLGKIVTTMMTLARLPAAIALFFWYRPQDVWTVFQRHVLRQRAF